jgi:hypothetical protein
MKPMVYIVPPRSGQRLGTESRLLVVPFALIAASREAFEEDLTRSREGAKVRTTVGWVPMSRSARTSRRVLLSRAQPRQDGDLTPSSPSSLRPGSTSRCGVGAWFKEYAHGMERRPCGG